MDIFKKMISSFDNFYFGIGFLFFVLFFIFSDYNNEEKFGVAIFALVFIWLPYNIFKKGMGLIESSDEKNKPANSKTLGVIFIIVATIMLYWALSLKI